MISLSEIDFAKKCLNYNEYEDIDKKKALMIVKALDHIDTNKTTYFEYSFKIRNNKFDTSIRFLNMDCRGYSWKNQVSNRKRIDLFSQILKKYCTNKDIHLIINSLYAVSVKPMDIYFGFDAKKGKICFAYWLILGGVSKQGEVSLVKYDREDLLQRLLTEIKANSSVFNKNTRPVLNFGIDIDENSIHYKLYYLLDDKDIEGYSFSKFMPMINKAFEDKKFFYFFSEMYNLEGKLIKDKLFMEFLEDIENDEAGISYICDRLSKLNISIDTNLVRKLLENSCGKLCLISYEEDGTVTFYVRS